MYENLLALHTVDPSDQEVITVEDVYVASESVGTQSANKQAKRSRVPVEEPLKDFNWPLQEEEFVVTLQEDGWNLGSVQSYNQQQDSICVQALTTLKTRARMIWEKHIGSIPKKKFLMTLKGNTYLKSGL